jgi:hypothetical protein
MISYWNAVALLMLIDDAPFWSNCNTENDGLVGATLSKRVPKNLNINSSSGSFDPLSLLKTSRTTQNSQFSSYSDNSRLRCFAAVNDGGNTNSFSIFSSWQSFKVYVLSGFAPYYGMILSTAKCSLIEFLFMNPRSFILTLLIAKGNYWY